MFVGRGIQLTESDRVFIFLSNFLRVFVLEFFFNKIEQKGCFVQRVVFYLLVGFQNAQDNKLLIETVLEFRILQTGSNA